jgi:PiT family inorganic phosphate transporter
MNPRFAMILAAVMIGLGPALLGVAVANTIGNELLQTDALAPIVIIAGLSGAIIWSTFTFWAKVPSSISQSLFGGLIGAAITHGGISAIHPGGFGKILVALFLSPIIGVFGAYFVVRLIYLLTTHATPRINRSFNRLQVLMTIIIAISLGANDGQKIIAMFGLGLLTTHATPTFETPLWSVVLSGCIISLGTLVGGWRLIKTLGGRIYKIRPIHGVSAQLTSGSLIMIAALVGLPVSGTQVVTGSIIGAGSADRVQMIRWEVVQDILVGWMLTIPLSGLTAAAIYELILRRII